MKPFLRYFFRYIFAAKTKQPLLFIAIAGLVISSFALLFLQATMGGLQSKLIERSKSVHGLGVVQFPYKEKKELTRLYKYLDQQNVRYRTELVLELLINSYNHYAPIIVHGLEKDHDSLPFYDGRVEQKMLVGSDLSIKLGLLSGEQVRLISPAHVDPFMGNIPRMASFYIDSIVTTDVPEVDSLEAWVPLLQLQALLGERKVNRVRLLSEFDVETLRTHLKDNFDKSFQLLSWEESNSTLVWALSLETTVMVFLFSCMCLLVSLSITSGMMLFFDKIKRDLASFWILGKDEGSIYYSLGRLLMVMIFVSVISGVVLGTGALELLDRYGTGIMPAVFVDQKIPVHLSTRIYMISVAIPAVISLIFSWLALRAFKKEVRYLDYVTTL